MTSTQSFVETGPKAIIKAAEILKSGGLVAIPTETVYGLGANAHDGKAVSRIFEVKNRPDFNPLIVHFGDLKDVSETVQMNEVAYILADAFWPGPITFVLPRLETAKVSDLCSAGLPTLAVRMPKHPVAREILKSCGFPVAAPSANISGRLSPTAAQHVANGLGDAVDLIVAGGSSETGLESTVVDLTSDVPVVLRPGTITKEDIEKVLGYEIEQGFDLQPDQQPKSPGQTLSHYSPSVPLRMNAVDLYPGEALLAFGSDKFIGIKGGGAAADLSEHSRRNLSEQSDLYEAAANLFQMLHELDRADHKGIAVMPIPNLGVGVAINDRLRRASAS